MSAHWFISSKTLSDQFVRAQTLSVVGGVANNLFKTTYITIYNIICDITYSSVANIFALTNTVPISSYLCRQCDLTQKKVTQKGIILVVQSKLHLLICCPFNHFDGVYLVFFLLSRFNTFLGAIYLHFLVVLLGRRSYFYILFRFLYIQRWIQNFNIQWSQYKSLKKKKIKQK